MERALVGVDGSANSLHALTWAAELSQRAGYKYIAARVFDPTQAERSPDIDAELRKEQREELEAWCHRLPGQGPSQQLLLDGGSDEALLGAALSERAGVIVIGARQYRGLTGPPVGSVAHRLVHATTVPLAIVPPDAPLAVDHLVVGMDGSPGSLAAVHVAADLATRTGAGVIAVYAEDPLFELVPDSDPRSWKHATERLMRRWTEPITALNVPLELDIERDDNAVAAISRAVASHPRSVVCVGMHRLSEVTGLRVGHIPLELMHRRDAVVILVPAVDRDR